TFLMKSDKFSLWGFNSWRGNPWFSSATPSDNSFMFYNGDQNPIPTPRLEAFREGIEDMHMLLEAQELLKKTTNSALSNLVSEKCINDVMKADDPDKTAAWRTSLLEALDSAE
ncbi:MAG: DUF4091 domain-containing protein, partial [Lentisphaeria bacterium]|nr:DUF4091 domain-containing protein [Lentisphaeria bacterium]